MSAGTESTEKLSLPEPGDLGLGRTRWANRGYSRYVGEHYDGCLWPGRTGLWERVPRIFVLHRVTADQAEALRVWSTVGVLAVQWLWEAWRCQ